MRRSGIGNAKSGKSAHATQQHALGKDLADDAAPPRAEGHADGDFGAARGGARQHQVGDIGAGNEQHDRGKNHQHLQALARVLLQVLDAAAAGREDDVLSGMTAEPPFAVICGLGVEPLAQRDGELGLQRADVGSGADSADGIEPV